MTTWLENVNSVVTPQNTISPLQCHLNLRTSDSLPTDSQDAHLLPNNQCRLYVTVSVQGKMVKKGDCKGIEQRQPSRISEVQV